MGMTWEFFGADADTFELWTPEEVAEETGEELEADQLALTIGGDAVAAIVGTRDQLRALVAKLAEVIDPKPDLPVLPMPAVDEDADDLEGVCPHVWTQEDWDAHVAGRQQWNADMRARHGAEANLYPEEPTWKVGDRCGAELSFFEQVGYVHFVSFRGSTLRIGDGKFADGGDGESELSCTYGHQWAMPDEVDYV